MVSLFPIKLAWSVIDSEVPGHYGWCAPVWVNRNILYNRLSGGTTGFFKNVKCIFPGVYITYGEDFHGLIKYRPISIWMDAEKIVVPAD